MTVPNGCRKQELRTKESFRKYMAEHLESWYEFANMKMGYEVGNGDLRLIIGCHKAPSWGMAAFSNESHTSNLRLQFRLLDETDRQSTGPAHEWVYASGHGMTEVRVGPSNDDDLRACDDQALCNQALFLLTLNGVLSEEQWTRIHRPCGQVLPTDTQAREGCSNATTSSSSLMAPGNRQASSLAAASVVGRGIANSGATTSDDADLRAVYHQADIRLASENRTVCGLCIQRGPPKVLLNA